MAAATLLKEPAETAVVEGHQFVPPKEVARPGEGPKKAWVKAHHIRPFIGLRATGTWSFWLRVTRQVVGIRLRSFRFQEQHFVHG